VRRILTLVALALPSAGMAAEDLIHIPMQPQDPAFVYSGWVPADLGCAAPKDVATITFEGGKRGYGVVVAVYNGGTGRGRLTFRLNGRLLGEVGGAGMPAGLAPAFFFADAQRMQAGKNTLEVRAVPPARPLSIQRVWFVVLDRKASPGAVGLRLTGWQTYATRYIFPPRLRFERIDQAAEYDLRLRTPSGPEQSVVWGDSSVRLDDVWRSIPPGPVTVIATAVDEDDVILAANVITFHKAREFDGAVSPPRYPAPEMARGVAEFLVDPQGRKAFDPKHSPLLWHATIRTDGVVSPVGYPTQNAYCIDFFLEYTQWTQYAPLARQALTVARALADWNVQYQTPSDARYPGVFYTTVQGGKVGGSVDGDSVVLPLTALMGRSLLRLGLEENDPRYVQAAVDAAKCLLSSQQDQGNWPFRVEPKSGTVRDSYTSSAILPVLFFDELIATPANRLPAGLDLNLLRARMRESRSRAMNWINGNPLTNYRWEGFCEDIPDLPPYAAIEWYDAGWTSKYLIEHRGEFPDQYSAALRLISWIEDQFACWHAADVPDLGSGIPIVPAVLEQYRRYAPIDRCNAWLLDVYLAAHKVTGDEMYLKKAKALASALTRARRPNGAIGTRLYYQTPEDARNDRPADLGDWFSCMAYDAQMSMVHEKALK
jgi:hypothetical protein